MKQVELAATPCAHGSKTSRMLATRIAPVGRCRQLWTEDWRSNLTKLVAVESGLTGTRRSVIRRIATLMRRKDAKLPRAMIGRGADWSKVGMDHSLRICELQRLRGSERHMSKVVPIERGRTMLMPKLQRRYIAKSRDDCRPAHGGNVKCRKLLLRRLLEAQVKHLEVECAERIHVRSPNRPVKCGHVFERLIEDRASQRLAAADPCDSLCHHGAGFDAGEYQGRSDLLSVPRRAVSRRKARVRSEARAPRPPGDSGEGKVTAGCTTVRTYS